MVEPRFVPPLRATVSARPISVALLAALSTCLISDVGCHPGPRSSGPIIAASNGLVAAAARDVLGPAFEVITLAEPGTCPGHFDVRPSQLRQLRSARLVLRFDFQSALDAQVGRAAGAPKIVAIRAPGGLCVPDTYSTICEQVAEAAIGAELITHDAATDRLASIAEANRQLAAALRTSVAEAGLLGRAVVSSDHQAEFCRFLGLEVAATLTTADRMTRSDIRRVLTDGSKAAIVIANLPEGTDLADALATSIDARVVVFGNFPEPDAHGGRFDALVRDNVRRLIESAAQ